ncbi:MAG TPA: DEAD/DEAH box helicase [Bryobacteraceae bacterium]|nr:DEAD/DEAH box helicase [Bryobacteraceae bacterium]
MFDPQTAALIRSAPPLEGLNLDELPKELTRAYAQIVSLRMRMRELVSADTFGAELGDIVRRLENIALTQEAFVVAVPNRENRASAAFVAATAHQLRYSAERILAAEEGPSRLSIEAIGPEIASTLMFLIAGRAADAAQMARNIRVGDPQSIEGILRQSIVNLARGQLGNIVERTWTVPDEVELSDNAATNLIWAELARGIQSLAVQLLGNVEVVSDANATGIFEAVRELCVEPIAFDGVAEVFSVFSGPHHLASLLHGASGVLAQAGVVNIEIPPGISSGDWMEFLRGLAKRRPYLWPNHRDALDTGYLNPGASAVVSFPTGAGKSTLAELKIGVARLLGKKVVFLAPTLALVDQVTTDLRKTFPEAETTTLADELEPEELTNIAVMTPERCLTLLGFSPDVFEDVGLLVFDECHLLHPRESSGRRSIDAMLCLLRFIQCVPDADVLLVSAMIKNADELAAWLGQLTKRECLSLALSWKPTRQARGCVVYPRSEINQLIQFVSMIKKTKKTKTFPAKEKQKLTAKPLGMFSLLQTWQTKEKDDYALLGLLDEAVLLGVSQYGALTSNRNEVAGSLAAASAAIGIKTLVFASQPSWCASIERNIEEVLKPRAVALTPQEKAALAMAIAECGGAEHTYCRSDAQAASHHGLLLSVERLFNESIFKRPDGIHALVATSTLAQGMNLPSQVVIIAGDDRFDATTNKPALLEAHELLNAAGRAGRAGEAAEGMVILVPSKVIAFDNEKNSITNYWFQLQSIFSNSDQCLEIEDPLTPILDRIQNDQSGLGPDESYFLRRLPFTVAEADEPSRLLLQNSFGAFKAAKKGDDEWITKRIEASLNRRAEVSGTESTITWEDELASSTGILDASQIRLIAARFTDQVAEPLGTVSQWVKWGLDWLQEDPTRLGMVVRPSSVESVFGAAVKGCETDLTKAAAAIAKIKEVTPLWIAGRPLNEIEEVISSKTTGKCDSAREWALRFVPELASFFYLIIQIFLKNREATDGVKPNIPLEFAKHGRCFREGLDSPEKLALRQLESSLTPRVVIHQRYEHLEPFLQGGPTYESFDDAKRRVRKARRKAGNE